MIFKTIFLPEIHEEDVEKKQFLKTYKGYEIYVTDDGKYTTILYNGLVGEVKVSESTLKKQNLNMSKALTLTVIDHADPSVGIFSTSYDVLTPFTSDEVDSEEREFFKQAIIAAYSEFAAGKVTAFFNDEKI